MNEDCFHLGVKALIQDRDGKLLLLKVNSEVLKGVGDAYWDIPGGRIEKGSNVEETLKREVREETGIQKITSVRSFGMVLSNIRIPQNKGDVGLILAIYLCDVVDLGEITLSDEHSKAGWFSKEEAAKLLENKYPKELTSQIIKAS